MLASAAVAQANPITVTVTGDPAGAGDCLNGSDCSLRQAIAAASSDDTIVLGSHLYSLTQGANLDITKSLTLTGDGVNATSIDGSQNIANSAPEPDPPDRQRGQRDDSGSHLHGRS